MRWRKQTFLQLFIGTSSGLALREAVNNVSSILSDQFLGP